MCAEPCIGHKYLELYTPSLDPEVLKQWEVIYTENRFRKRSAIKRKRDNIETIFQSAPLTLTGSLFIGLHLFDILLGKHIIFHLFSRAFYQKKGGITTKKIITVPKPFNRLEMTGSFA